MPRCKALPLSFICASFSRHLAPPAAGTAPFFSIKERVLASTRKPQANCFEESRRKRKTTLLCMFLWNLLYSMSQRVADFPEPENQPGSQPGVSYDYPFFWVQSASTQLHACTFCSWFAFACAIFSALAACSLLRCLEFSNHPFQNSAIVVAMPAAGAHVIAACFKGGAAMRAKLREATCHCYPCRASLRLRRNSSSSSSRS